MERYIYLTNTVMKKESALCDDYRKTYVPATLKIIEFTISGVVCQSSDTVFNPYKDGGSY